MSYLCEIEAHAAALSAAYSFVRATPEHSQVQGLSIAPNKKADMNYEAIKTRIQALIANAQQKPQSRVDAALEPIREDMLEARRQGVRLGELFKVIGGEAKDISPSSFAKYAQRHLQV